MTSSKSIGFMLAVFMFMLTIKLSWSNLQCLENERQALLSFKHNVRDPSNRLSSWEGLECCKWRGVSCDNMTGHVVKLDLHNPLPFNYDRATLENENGMPRDILYEEACLNVVEVSPSLVQLKHLNYLDLSWNNFAGNSIPNFFGSFQKLQYLNLSSALFGGLVPHHLGNLSSLSSLDLSVDGPYFISSDNPSQLTLDTISWTLNLSSLQHLDISGIDLTNFSQITTTLPYSLSELGLSSCKLTHSFLTKTIANMTSLRVLDLSSNSIGGPFPNFIRNMTSLKLLDLSHNSFTSHCPILGELKALKNLEALYLSTNAFEGELVGTSGNFSFVDSLEILDLKYNKFNGFLPDSLYQLKNLKSLDLSVNSFHGPIPASFGTFPNMKELDLAGNALAGSIPSSLGRLSSLESLHLQLNQLSGLIPTSLGKLSNLKALDLSNNHLSGQIPTSLGKLVNLEKLDLHDNQLSSVISEVHFAKLSKLKFLYLSNNSLSLDINFGWAPLFQLQRIDLTDCNVGPGFPHWLRTQTRLGILRMSNSGISDSMPNWFKDISKGLYVLDLSQNNISGSIPSSVCSSKRLYFLSLQKNHLSGELPQCWNASQLSFVDFSYNRITGSIPHSFCNFRNLEYLTLSNNNLSGELPRCWSNPYVEVLDFSFNLFKGGIPSSICELPNLQVLYLSHNLFHGETFKNLKNCTKLTRLDLGENSLSGEIPIWIGDLPELRILRLRSNKFTGILSTKLCDLKYLQILDVGDNHLSGTIPYCFGNFSAMSLNNMNWDINDHFSGDLILTQFIKGRELEYFKIVKFLVNLDLSSNNLVGQIPKELTGLSGLISLNFSRNSLTGQIPYKIGNLVSLESLDLSLNHLTGKIPQSMSSLVHLSVLNFSYNKLSGSIPSGNQLQTLTDPTIYQGNDGLCGPPLEKTCYPLHAPTPDDDDDDDERKKDGNSIGDLFYIGPILGYVVGFWVVCGTLFLKKVWRHAYFQLVDDIQEKVCGAVSIKIASLKEKLMKM